jgi:hypothetical protein
MSDIWMGDISACETFKPILLIFFFRSEKCTSKPNPPVVKRRDGANRLACAFYRCGGEILHSPRQLAEALNGHDARLTNDTIGGARAFESRLDHVKRVMPQRPAQVMMLFGEPPRRKILCSCGAIAEVDQGIAAKKMILGKAMECRACRNGRISRERDELEKHFSGQDDEREDW